MPNTGGGKDIQQAYRVAFLVSGFLKGNLTEEEKDELDQWILASEENMILFEKLTDEKNLAEAVAWFKKMDIEEELEQTKQKMAGRKKASRWRYIAIGAAAAITLLFTSLYIYKSVSVKSAEKMITIQSKDLSPADEKAYLTLEDGRQIVFDGNRTDTAINDRMSIVGGDGQLEYRLEGEIGELIYHTLTVPRKGHFKLLLPDGSKVWLNAESSIRYPVVFGKNERKVFVTGETFFEVAKDKSRPFSAVAGDIVVEALGTAFNVNVYNNEPRAAITLAEGSVMVTRGSTDNLLQPGQQARIGENSFEIKAAEIEDVTAWRNNLFRFRNTALDEIMRSVERWYDADVEYRDSLSLHLNATIERSVPVSRLLDILGKTDQVHFKIEGKKIIVTK